MKKLTLTCLFTVLLGLITCPADAQVFDEAVLGDFSGSSSAPTSLGALITGSSQIIGTTGGGDRDLVTFSIGAGQQLTSFEIAEFGPSAGSGSFFGFDDDNVAPGAANQFLYAGLETVTAGSPLEILGTSGGGLGGQGVPSILGPGDYLAFFNETGGVTTNYSVNINVVPEPGSLALFAAGFGFLLSRRKR